MVMFKPSKSAMDMLSRWPEQESMTTTEIIKITGNDWSTVYRWMMQLAIIGYFNRRSDPRRAGHGGGTIVTWTITKKGRERARELQGEIA